MKYFAIAILMYSLSALAAAHLPAASVGDQAPDFTFEKAWNTDASSLSQILAKRKLIILEQFASW